MSLVEPTVCVACFHPGHPEAVCWQQEAGEEPCGCILNVTDAERGAKVLRAGLCVLCQHLPHDDTLCGIPVELADDSTRLCPCERTLLEQDIQPGEVIVVFRRKRAGE